MTELPELKDWRTILEKQLNKARYTDTDMLKIIHLCQDHMGDIQPISQWLGQQESFIRQISREFTEMYFTMFGRQPPPRLTEVPVTEVLLDTPERRKQAVRETALSIAKPGDNITDETVLEELKRRGMKIDMPNPTAAISTILNGFKPQFEKVEGKRGVFTRQDNPDVTDPLR